jgi:hypothetical protein
MSRGEEMVKVPSYDPSWTQPKVSWNAYSVVANLVILAEAATFAILAGWLFLCALLMLPGAFLIGPHAFGAMAIIICVGAVCLVVALGLLLRHIAGWWCALFSTLAISLFSAWLLVVGNAPDVVRVQWLGGTFLALFIALLCVRRYYFNSARRLWLEVGS